MSMKKHFANPASLTYQICPSKETFLTLIRDTEKLGEPKFLSSLFTDAFHVPEVYTSGIKPASAEPSGTLTHLGALLLRHRLADLLGHLDAELLGHGGAVRHGDGHALLPRHGLALLVGHLEALLPGHRLALLRCVGLAVFTKIYLEDFFYKDRFRGFFYIKMDFEDYFSQDKFRGF